MTAVAANTDASLELDALYPLGPKDVPADLAQPSSAYKQRAWLALAMLVIFMALYVALAGWFIWIAYRITTNNDGAHILIGICAAFLAIFMLKALFFVNRAAPNAIELKRAEHRRLFDFLYRLADEAGAPRPRRVYLSAGVNASVFYELSIFNLVMPTHKNLEIGLPLVNVLTLSELKAVLAHEFGHFAQRSMAIGAWVYVAHQIAAHIVAKRDALDRVLSFISRFDIRVAWIGWLLSLIVWSIRSLVETLLRLVVLAERALSRQMEFQADLVSVSLTGSDELVSALRKLAAADDSWRRTLNFADAEIRKGRIPHDLFAVQTRILQTMAHILADDSYGKSVEIPAENPQGHRVFQSKFVLPPKMWSTHPSNIEREDNAKYRYFAAPRDSRSAWLLFDNQEAAKAIIASQLLAKAKGTPISAEETFRDLDDSYARAQFDHRYRGVYLGRPLTRQAEHPEELYDTAIDSTGLVDRLNALYPPELAQDAEKLSELSEERTMLEALVCGGLDSGKKIVYRGREIAPRQLPAAIREITAAENSARQKILAHDRNCRNLHLVAAEQLGGGWKEYLIGLMGVLHYAEHSTADLRDARGYFEIVFSAVTAKHGGIREEALERLLTAGDAFGRRLMRVMNQKRDVQLDPQLLKQLGAAEWASMLPDFVLPAASAENISAWLPNSAALGNIVVGTLGTLASSALEQLLIAEDEIAKHVREDTPAPAAPTPSRIPAGYAVLPPGRERDKHEELDLWTRFQTADGPLFAVARMLIAVAIVGTVLGVGTAPDYFLAPKRAVASVTRGAGTGRIVPAQRSAGIGSAPAASQSPAQRAAQYGTDGRNAFAKGAFDDAIANFTRQIELGPDASAYFNRASAYFKKNDYDAAIRDLDQTIALKPNFYGAHTNRGIAHLFQKDYKRAITDFDSAIKVNGTDAMAYLARSDAHARLGHTAQAKRDKAQAMRLDPTIKTK